MTIPLINSADNNPNTQNLKCNPVKETSYPISAFTCTKTIIQPQEHLMINVCTEIVPNNENLLFEPKKLARNHHV